MSEIKTGSHISRKKTTFKKSNDELSSDYYGEIATGIIPLILNIAFFLTILLCGIYIPNERIKWNDAFVIASYSTFCLILIWSIFRRDVFRESRFHFFSMWKKSFGYGIKNKVSKKTYDFKEKINDKEDYEKFLEKRKDKTKIFFWVSFSIHSLLVLVSSILVIVIK